MEEALTYMILEIVGEIPAGKVASYKQLAIMAGYPKNARLVGKIMSHADYYGKYPCHRVVHNDGSLVNFWQEQKNLLLEEGVSFKANGKVDMKSCQWRGINGNQTGTNE